MKNKVITLEQKIRYSKSTNIGGREVNEDSIGVYVGENRYGFIVCDGLGGHGMGDVASGIVRDVFIEMFKKMDNPSKEFKNAFQAAQDILMAEQSRLKATKKMKTTAVSLLIDKKKAYIGHIGDSRLYIFNDNQIYKRTLDHSIPQMLVITNEIKESEIRNHPDRSMILKVMGVEWDEPMYEIMKPVPLKKCQAFLLCTDGFWELIEDDVMCKCLETSDSPDDWMNKMRKIIEINGEGKNMDNNSAIEVWCN